jgi:hypothetical protein
MRAILFSTMLLLLLVRAIPMCPQSVNMEHPPEINAQHTPTPEERRSRVSDAQVQKDAKELAALCISMPADLDAVQQGMMPKDLVDKLNRLEKLSKRVRQGLAR